MAGIRTDGALETWTGFGGLILEVIVARPWLRSVAGETAYPQRSKAATTTGSSDQRPKASRNDGASAALFGGAMPASSARYRVSE